MQNPVICFEIGADDVQRAKEFYEKTFGWKITWMPAMEYFLVETEHEEEPGINGGLRKRTEPGYGITTYIQIDSVNETLEQIRKNGGTVILHRHPIAGFGTFALFRDPEGNVLGLHEIETS
ncbi:MAG: VOC family protein [Methanomicrobiales archaeon]|nr:VOC family protein [Methanomicrobiales archaeon]